MEKLIAFNLYRRSDRNACVAVPGAPIEAGNEVYRAEDVDVRIAELEKALREAMEWNWMDGDVPLEIHVQCDKALGPSS